MAKPTPKNPVILPTQKRSVITFENILEATTYLIEEIGIQKITTNKIADRSGVNINSLYQYFLDKNAIIRLITERLLEENETAFRQSLRNSTGLKNKERALAIIQDSLNIFTRRPNLNREILLYMPLIIGLEKQEQMGNLLAKSLLEVIPNELYPSDKTKQIAAEMLVHTF
ncbi:MAG: TetR/AcrR family transcriptional regulator, partial [Methyloligellaceae bacterium]